ncbi:hypothetical protein SETIT_3G039800v2 [Setaria italica]|uniref:PDZ domain-containing protein n=2 Tax=Setaria TaxID=4554 RepID=A0A368QBW8_SETIT|nr:hypothetical protein SETIT_3G039800v2 [Setaria italica]TKW24262.1 hypothetical protein SEVIR_3G041100v2 [Setaria viridis]
MKCLGIKCLNLVSKEKISQKYRVDAGLIIVEELFISIEAWVSGGSNAEKLGVRMGDIIQAVNGECIATAVQGPFGKGIGCDSDVDVMVVLAVFNTTKRVSGRIQLMAKLSHDAEIIAIAIHLLSTLDQSLAQ